MTSETESMKRQTQNEFCKLWFATMLFICFVKISSTFIELFNRIAQTRPEFRTTDNFMLSPGKSSLNWSVCWNHDRKLSNYDFNWWHFCVHHTTLAHRMLSFYFIFFSFHSSCSNFLDFAHFTHCGSFHFFKAELFQLLQLWIYRL